MKTSQVGDLYAQADAALQAAEGNRGIVMDGVLMEQYQIASDLFEKASILEAETTGKGDTL